MVQRASCILLLGLFAVLQLENVAAQGPAQLEWIQDLQNPLMTGLHEDQLLRRVIGRLNARHPQGRRVTYNVTSDGNILFVNPISGDLSLVSPLDREKKDRYNVRVSAKDDAGNMVYKTYVMPVLDVNDNPPIFQTPSGGIIADVWEDAAVSSTVMSDIRVDDPDLGSNSTVTLSCYVPERDEGAQKACAMFGVRTTMLNGGVYSGSIVLKQRLDSQPERKYILTLAATDGGSPPRTSYTNVDINVRRHGDAVPRFLDAPVSLNIFEGTRGGVQVGELRVQDANGGNSQNMRIKIARGHDGLGWFRLGRPTKENQPSPVYVVPIITNGFIDREGWDGVYQFDVEAIELLNGIETTSSSRTTVRVTIRDMNDNSPRFIPTNNYEIKVPEGLNTGTKLPGLDLVVVDDDEGTNSQFGLTLQEDTYGAFSLSPFNCTGKCAVSLVVRNTHVMDYEDRRYRNQTVKVVAREMLTANQLSSTATVTVLLVDQNDNVPVFPQTQYSFSVEEDRPVGYLIATIRATDVDSGELGEVRYSIASSDRFKVNELTGEIRLAKKLDYEQQKLFSLMYEARDLGGRVKRVPLEITVLNSNDQGPEFVNRNYDVVLPQGSTQIRINITAIDREQSGVVTYRITEGNTADNAFVINPFTGVVSLVRPITYADTRGTGYIRLVVQASNGGSNPQTASIPITITVQNVNNRRPVFSQSFYQASVPETAIPGQSVVSVQASDSDSGRNGQVSYRIASGSFNNFNIDSNSGLIRVSQNANLDLQNGRSTYRMTVQAVDDGSPQMTGETQVTVTVTDANNKPPQFIQNVYLTSLLDSELPGTSILQLVASDPDTDRRLEYSIQRDTVSAKDSTGQDISPAMLPNYRDAFAVNSLTGIITSQRQFSRDQVGEISFRAQVRDLNAQSPSVQTATATVIVTITTNTRQQLEFSPPLTAENPDIRVSVPEEADVGYVVYNLVALDPNTNRPVSIYEKVSGTDPMNYFFVNRQNGRITMNRRLDFERLSNNDLSLQVRATTGGSAILSAVARIIVTVTDINDNSPIFSQNSYQFTIQEGQQFPIQIGVSAVDTDSGEFGRIRYSLTGRGHQYFYIDPIRGTISVARNATLDREAIGGVFNLLAKATDNPDGPQNQQLHTDVPVTITVTDVNDNPPLFTQAQYNLYTRDNARAGTALGTVSATDADSDLSGTITYSIMSGNLDDLFQIDRNTGVIRNQRDLTGYAKQQPYELEIAARDNGIPALSSIARVNIFISDLQGGDDIPHIIDPARDGQTFSVPEDARRGTNITRINAAARGSTPGTVTYRFFDNPLLNDQTYFRIDPLTGVISLVKPLDRELQGQYQLIVVVENRLAGTENRRSLFVNVADLDDNKPSFLSCPGIHVNPLVAEIYEDAALDTEIIQLNACDLDDAPNNKVYYYIVKGNEPLAGQTTPPFSIGKSTGHLRSRITLDREATSEYLLYVKASSDPNLNTTNYPVNASLGSIQTVRVLVKDVDDNGPSFGSGTTFSTGVLSTARYHTKLLIVRAKDQDVQTPFDTTTYSLQDSQFFREGDAPKQTPDAFVIGEDSGLVSTNLPNYLDYQNGYFRMTVKAVDQKKREDFATLFIYVIRESQRLRFNFNLPPEEVVKIRSEFMREVNQTLGNGIRINDDSIHYHTDDNNVVVESSTDLCFHMVKDNRVVQPDEAFRILDDMKNQLDPIYAKYKVKGPGLCSVKPVTYNWSDHWWLWWILIALTLLIMLISLICICVLCCCWRRSPPEPYVNLDPGADYMPNKEYEWQQRTVRME